MPGDCYCKQNVIGRICNMCKDEFYHLTQDNAFGCKGTCYRLFKLIARKMSCQYEFFVTKTISLLDHCRFLNCYIITESSSE